MDSHAYFLRVQGALDKTVEAIIAGTLEAADLSPAERALLKYAELITGSAARSTAEDVQRLRDVGWTEEQISEAVYVIAIFAFFNRVADAFGVSPQNYLATGRLTP